MLTAYHTAQQTAGIADPASPTGDTDGDGIANVLEVAFGTQPGNGSTGVPALIRTGTNLIATGQPIVEPDTGSPTQYRAVFIRRKDAATLGLTYTVHFTANLTTWTPAPPPPPSSPKTPSMKSSPSLTPAPSPAAKPDSSECP